MWKNIVVLLVWMPQVLFAAEYPSLLDIEVGNPFAHPNALQFKDTDRPTTQFSVPNYGASAELFPEYTVSYLNKSNNVAIVTAEKAVSSWGKCDQLKKDAMKLANGMFPNYKATPRDESQLKAEGEFASENSDVYYVLRCQGSYGPFAYLHFQVRSVSEDAKLKAAWGEFFKTKNR